MSGAYPNATIYPHAAMTAAQIEWLCEERGLELVHHGRGRFELVPVDALRAFRRQIERNTKPEAA